jgi:hypothetical protein
MFEQPAILVLKKLPEPGITRCNNQKHVEENLCRER